MYSAKILGKQMDSVYGLYLPEYTVPAPEAQTDFVEIIGRDGAIDKTAPDGVVRYKDREWNLIFKKTGVNVSANDVPALSSQLMNDIHGRRGEVIFDDDTSYKWIGRVFVQNVYCENNGMIYVEIQFISEPYKYGIQDIVVTDTVETEVNHYTGDIATFNFDDSKILLGVDVSMTPIQDLHGYSNPWPGGGGVNKFGVTDVTDLANGSSIKLSISDGLLTVTATGGISSTVIVGQSTLANVIINATLSAGTYYFKIFDFSSTVTGATADGIKLRIETNGTNTDYARDTAFTLSADSTIVGFYVASALQWNSGNTMNFRVAISATNVDAWTPYSNICPITGRTGLTVYRTGFNLCQDSVHTNHFWESGVLKTNKNANYAAIDIKVPVAPGEDYCVYVPDNTGGIMYFSEFDESESYLRLQQVSISRSNFAVFTATAGTRFIAVGFYKSGGVLVGERICVSLSGPNDGTYKPYQGTTYSLDWSTQAGTVYHGTVDPVSGQLTVDWVSIEYDGSSDESWLLNITTEGNAIFQTVISGSVSITNDNNDLRTRCDKLTAYPAYHLTRAGRPTYACGLVSNHRLFVILPSSSVADVTALRSWLGSNNLNVVYELATPLTYQLTPQEVTTLLGINNVWSDSGDVDVSISVMDMVTLANGRKPIVPKIDVTSDSSVTIMFYIKGVKKVATMSSGSWKVSDLILFEGNTDVYESGSGTIKYSYPEASL